MSCLSAIMLKWTHSTFSQSAYSFIIVFEATCTCMYVCTCVSWGNTCTVNTRMILAPSEDDLVVQIHSK